MFDVFIQLFYHNTISKRPQVVKLYNQEHILIYVIYTLLLPDSIANYPVLLDKLFPIAFKY